MKHQINCSKCGTSMSVSLPGPIGPKDEFLCGECHKTMGGTGQIPNLPPEEEEKKDDRPMMETRDKLWGSDGMVLLIEKNVPGGVAVDVGVLDGVNAEDVSKKTMNTIRMAIANPEVCRVIVANVVYEMRRPISPTAVELPFPHNRLNGNKPHTG